MLAQDGPFVGERAGRKLQAYGFLLSYRAMLDREGAGGPGDVALVGGEATVKDQVLALADIGVTDFIAASFGSGDERRRTRALLESLL